MAAQDGNELGTRHKKVLLDLWESGQLVGGVENFGEHENEGKDNGLFCCVLQKKYAPDPSPSRLPDDAISYWAKDNRLKKYTYEALLACLAAGFPFAMEGDSTRRSSMGVAAEEARARGLTRLGMSGTTKGVGLFSISDDLAAQLKEGWVGEELAASLGTKTWTVENFEVGVVVDISAHFVLLMSRKWSNEGMLFVLYFS